MSIILHHTDADGYCSARIAKENLIDVFDNNTIFIPYNYKGDGLKKIDFHDQRKLIITDLCCNAEIEELIRSGLKYGCTIIHIDHHQSGIDYYNEHMTDLDDNKSYNKFFSTRESASMLIWVYTHMSDEQKQNAENVFFDFEDDYSHFIFDDKFPRFIPIALRYINDNDVFRNQFAESKKFTAGFYGMSRKEIMPASDVWNTLIFSSIDPLTPTLIAKGDDIIKDREKQYMKIRKKAFTCTIYGIDCVCINTSEAGSAVFGDLYNKHDVCVRFSYDGPERVWTYTLYSDKKVNTYEDIVKRWAEDYKEIVMSHGGHPYASGCSTSKCLFDIM